jgi:hypothetical protein
MDVNWMQAFLLERAFEMDFLSMLESGYNSYHTCQRYFLCHGWSCLLNPNN